VILATGADLKKLGIPGEAELENKGVGHCASCDAPLLRGKTVAVVGGGDAACQEGLVLAAHAAQVLLLHRGPELTAQPFWRARVAAQANLACRPHSVVEAILGTSEVSGLRVRDLAGGATADLAVDAVFAFIGLAPNSRLVVEFAELDARGALVTDIHLRATPRGLFAAGSVRAANSGQAAAAAGDGIQAAYAAHTFLATGAWPAACT
jgi:thioredoxin reductase (NADPH)